MRIITGKYKGRHFEVPRSFQARPTTDFAKENLFNVLQGYIDFSEAPTALDLFSGTGSITLELVSRGCGRVISVELDARHHRLIKQFLDKLQDEAAVPVRGDAFQFVAKCREQFDFIFADPPYTLKELPIIPDLIFGTAVANSSPFTLHSSLLKPGGLFVLEHGKSNDFSQHPRFVEHRSYGSVNFSFFQ